MTSTIYQHSIPAQPWALRSEIVKGFQRGGTQLGFPTANLQLNEQITTFLKRYLNTVWAGYCIVEGDSIVDGQDIEGLTKHVEVVEDPVQFLLPFVVANNNNNNSDGENGSSNNNNNNQAKRVPTRIYPTVLSVGTNPHFKNVALTVEPYICHKFNEDFYGRTLRLIAVQPMRTMGAFTTLEALKAQIWDDCVVGSQMLMESGKFCAKWRDGALMDPRVFAVVSSSANKKEPVFKSYSSTGDNWQTCEEMNSAQL